MQLSKKVNNYMKRLTINKYINKWYIGWIIFGDNCHVPKQELLHTLLFRLFTPFNLHLSAFTNSSNFFIKLCWRASFNDIPHRLDIIKCIYPKRGNSLILHLWSKWSHLPCSVLILSIAVHNMCKGVYILEVTELNPR